MRITFISDTHTIHHKIPKEELPGGDILIHCGDISSRGYREEIRQFLNWFELQDNYTHKVFIAGNHDFFFQDNPIQSKELISEYPKIIYLQDNMVEIDQIKIYGSPWQPEFYNWAFNLPRNGEKLMEKWRAIPSGIDILVTHGPPFGILDYTVQGLNVGCEVLIDELKRIKPIIHSFGHIHYAYGVRETDSITFINASNLGENYRYQNKPITIDFDIETKTVTLI
jgi:Icc-related predicted phosphoesterase